MYCTGIGSSSRYCWRIFAITLGSRSSPAMTSAGLPGNRCCSEKISTDTKNRVGISCRMRLPRKFNMERPVSRAQRSVQRCDAEPGSIFGWVPDQQSAARALLRIRDTRGSARIRSLQFQPNDTHQSIRHRPVALKPGRVRDQELAVIEIDDGFVLEHEAGHFLIDRLAHGRIGDQTRILKTLVDVRVGVDAVILRRLGVQEDVSIAVGIDPAAPSDQESLEFAGLGLLEGGREFDQANLQVEAGLR